MQAKDLYVEKMVIEFKSVTIFNIINHQNGSSSDILPR